LQLTQIKTPKIVQFTKKDLEQIKSKGLSVEKVQQQIDIFKKEIPFVNLRNAATPGNGILTFNEEELSAYASAYEKSIEKINVVKFVPASGAATRMFKEFYKFLESFNYKSESLNSYLNYEKATAIRLFLIGLEKFPFYHLVFEATKKNYPNFEELTEGKQLYVFVKTMLKNGEGLNYGSYPKGLLPFHKYKKSGIRTAFGEHLHEAVSYSNINNKASLHFTVSKEHLEDFKEEFDSIRKTVEDKTDTTFNISYSTQKEFTDTIAVDLNNEPFRNEDGSILFRPGGHGALIENLNDIDADLVFIKNIDNVVVRKYQEELAVYKKALAGKLLEIQRKVFSILDSIEKEMPNEKALAEISAFLKIDLNIDMPVDFNKFSDEFKRAYLIEVLNRPIRVCGMVRNEGEPGGGPFWIKNERGRSELQIIESAQIDLKNPNQQKIMRNSTHFNPVDLICGMKNYKGKKFNLLDYVDEKAAFITNKTIRGEQVKALELPGLWNGGMAKWNSIFVEVPLITFNPVKSVNDLLKSAHQVKMF